MERKEEVIKNTQEKEGIAMDNNTQQKNETLTSNTVESDSMDTESKLENNTEVKQNNVDSKVENKNENITSDIIQNQQTVVDNKSTANETEMSDVTKNEQTNFTEKKENQNVSNDAKENIISEIEKQNEQNTNVDKVCDTNLNVTSDVKEFIARIQGCPKSTSSEDIIKFFDGSNIKNGAQGIHFVIKESQQSKQAYIEFESENDLNVALTKDKKHINNKCIVVFKSDKKEMKNALCDNNKNTSTDACVRLRGLSLKCTKKDIIRFFKGLKIAKDGIFFPNDYRGRPTGDAYVQFVQQDSVKAALQKHKHKIAYRCVKVFKSCLKEMKAVKRKPRRNRNRRFGNRNLYNQKTNFFRPRQHATNQNFRSSFGKNPSLYTERNDNDYQHLRRKPCILMKGLPDRINKADICKFFAPITPANITIFHEPNRYSTAEASVEFYTYKEAMNAMKRDNKRIMPNQPIKLFLQQELPENAPRNVFEEAKMQMSFKPISSYSLSGNPEMTFNSAGQTSFYRMMPHEDYNNRRENMDLQVFQTRERIFEPERRLTRPAIERNLFTNEQNTPYNYWSRTTTHDELNKRYFADERRERNFVNEADRRYFENRGQQEYRRYGDLGLRSSREMLQEATGQQFKSDISERDCNVTWF